MEKDRINTRIGYFPKDANEFITHDGEVLENVTTYKSVRERLGENLLVANIQWSESAQCWIMFQHIEVTEEFLELMKQ